MKNYDPRRIESKWQKYWEQKKLFQAKGGKKKKFYALVEFPYPSGEGLHVGHVRSYTALDTLARKRRAEGYDVLYPMGWDAFGLPTENYAIKTGIQPAAVTKTNTNNFRRQIKSLGLSFDWSREINTTDPAYYKWTQWIFLQFFKRGLAYKAKSKINWCPSCKIGLANEEVVGDKCERCGTPVLEREKEQWMLGITKYADRLERDLDLVDYPESIKLQQRNWIGKKDGWEIEFKIGEGLGGVLKVFTTRPETIFGVTFIAIAGKTDRFTGQYAVNPANGEKIPIWEAEYVMSEVGTGAIMGVPAHDARDFAFAKKHNLPIREVVIPEVIDKGNPPQEGFPVVERQVIHAIIHHPKTGKILLLRWKKFPWKTLVIGGVEKEDGGNVVAAAEREIREETGFKNLKYVRTLGGLVRAQFFAAHKNENRLSYTNALVFDLLDDERDEVNEEELAKHEVFWGTLDDVHPCAEIEIWKERYQRPTDDVYVDEGILVNSAQFTGQDSNEAKEAIVKLVRAKPITTYKLRDWVFSRQRYWGEPIPLIWCEACSEWQAVPEKDLPVKLPKVKDFRPTENGDSPLAKAEKWLKVKCPKCAGSAVRETDVMPNWAGSSWYYLAYVVSSKVKSQKSKLQARNQKFKNFLPDFKQWLPVDWYNGGTEHTTLHLLYSRFWHKFLYDQKLVPTAEPYKKRSSHGFILAPDGQKMSKSRGNVINPDEIVVRFGADVLRLYELFIGPFNQTVAWNENGLVGMRRFLERVWRLAMSGKLAPGNSRLARLDPSLKALLNQTIDKVGRDIEQANYNTAVSALMILLNQLEKESAIPQVIFGTFLQLLNPFAPHLAEELWRKLGHNQSICLAPWPKAKGGKESTTTTITVQVDGRARERLTVPPGLGQEAVLALALENPTVKKWLAGQSPKQIFFVPDRVINLHTA